MILVVIVFNIISHCDLISKSVSSLVGLGGLVRAYFHLHTRTHWMKGPSGHAGAMAAVVVRQLILVVSSAH